MDAPEIEAGLIHHIADKGKTGEGEAFPDAGSLYNFAQPDSVPIGVAACSTHNIVYRLGGTTCDRISRLFPEAEFVAACKAPAVMCRLFNTT
ncbi:hypothetical protein [Rhizobium leguminosarum]|uniref:hypothetical protein n=1 Tax=Rhizobium leguminosarum TaxID=384 RepID=UPI001C98D40E|nr:hypothetical protein [Rhizobium leguminosarum]MBY5519176.1 hypothetical protein [Rhizobium leguminosarum]MBY5651853.1 hypothetical protein [Rhizobium leguminosarum]MBY5699082.1 hypothetical protein [Rhizobium leguminosarum]